MTSSTISVPEQKRIKAEIEEEIRKLIEGCETLDMDLAFQPFSDSPAFLMMGTDGSLVDYRTYVKNNVEYLRGCSKFDLETKRGELRVLARDVAVYAWSYRAEAELKTGEKDIIDEAGASFLFQKIAQEWKVVYYHESSNPPRREPAPV